MTPLVLVVIVAGAASAFAWVASLITGDTSWVDRSWSILPVVYVWIFALAAHFADATLDVAATVVALWGLRLTFNFARKGGYRGVEDYRWAVLRAAMRPWQFQIFNLTFIVLYQNLILVLISLPALTIYQHRARTHYALVDLVLAAAFVACTIGEAVGDEQQWRFQCAKQHALDHGRAPAASFLTEGLFRYSRHPAYYFELAQWWLLFFMGAAAADSLGQWTVVGPILLSLLFVGSTRFTERITLSRYPDYRDYQRSTSSVVSKPVRRTRPRPAGTRAPRVADEDLKQ